MSDIAGTPSSAGPLPVDAPETVQESYALACMRCGYGWEQTYDIEHHIDGAGRPFFTYRVEGRLVPSPLNRLTCLNCGGQKVRIMRAGQVSGLAESLRRQHFAPPNFATAGPVPASEPEPGSPRRRHGERRGVRYIGRHGGGAAEGPFPRVRRSRARRPGVRRAGTSRPRVRGARVPRVCGPRASRPRVWRLKSPCPGAHRAGAWAGGSAASIAAGETLPFRLPLPLVFASLSCALDRVRVGAGRGGA
ncbi:hypothetical protein [Streptomyces sp. I6]|uniref:hypothetical protein n=1 Tax=Streptomyces sp. I6 TaxID=2483113 RepID=UPI002880A7D2|nr:hypothetical protein [Streptomyces sp. I6]